MLKRDRIINKLRELGYSFKREAPNTYIWRRGSHRVFVPKTDQVSETWARATLASCGCVAKEIDSFIQAARA